MPGSLRIGKIAGIDIYVHVSWLIILVLLTFSLATGWFPAAYPGASTGTYILLGLIASVLLFVSVLLHELGHSLVARARNLPVNSIVLFIFGGVSNIEREPQSAGVEFQLAFVGPLISLLIGGLSYLLLLPLAKTHSPVVPILSYLAISNVLLGIFNLIPGFPLDGGRVLHSIIWRVTGNALTATRVATFVGQVIAYLFILGGIWLFFAGNAINGIWFGFIGWFLLTSANSARSQAIVDTTFRGVTVREVMKPASSTVPANISVQRLVDEHFLPEGLRSAPVLQGDQLAGLVTLSDIRHVPRENWAQTTVGQIMVPIERLHVVSPEQNLADVLPMMTKQNINQVPVVENGALVGMLNREVILQSLQVRRSLGVEKAA